MDDKQDLVRSGKGNIMAFKYDARFSKIEKLTEFPTKRKESKIRLSLLHGYNPNYMLFDLRVFHEGKPCINGIFLSEDNMKMLMKYMDRYLNNSEKAPDIIRVLGYDPFDPEA